MNWREHMQSNSLSAAEAARCVKSGDRVVTGHAAAEPALLTRALTERASELRGVEICHMLALSDAPYCRPEYAESFRFNGIYVNTPTRAAVNEGRADFTPVFFSYIPELLRSPDFPVDVAMISASLPDEEGRVSLGPSVDYAMQAALSARLTLAIVNPNVPYVGGGALLDVQRIHKFVQADPPLFELPPAQPGPVETAIGNNLAELIPDGACLQVGIGAIPDAALSALDGKKDLGIHSEMISDGVMRLVEKGVINCARKTLHPGRIVFTFAAGSKDFYRWMDHNPMLEGYPVDYVNDSRVIGKNDKLISINSALSVDLLGQVAADAIGTRQFSAVGGQLDFVRGAAFSKGGVSVIAMPSTASGGKVSRICSTFSPGQAVTTSRNDVECVATEYGLARLKGKSCRQRAEALIAIAAPAFREQLAKEACDVYGLRLSI